MGKWVTEEAADDIARLRKQKVEEEARARAEVEHGQRTTREADAAARSEMLREFVALAVKRGMPRSRPTWTKHVLPRIFRDEYVWRRTVSWPTDAWRVLTIYRGGYSDELDSVGPRDELFVDTDGQLFGMRRADYKGNGGRDWPDILVTPAGEVASDPGSFIERDWLTKCHVGVLCHVLNHALSAAPIVVKPEESSRWWSKL